MGKERRRKACGSLRAAEPADACAPVMGAPGGRGGLAFVLIARGNCSFEGKVRAVQRAGFDAALVHDDEEKASLYSMLLWLLVAVSVKLGQPHIARNAVELMKRRLAKDDFPEYYDGKTGRYIGKQSRKFQTWSVAGYLVAKMLLDDPSNLRAVSLEDDGHIREPVLKRSNSCPGLHMSH